MKYQRLASLGTALVGAATVSASPLAVRNTNQCPSGYTMSVYYETVLVTSSTTPIPEPTSTSTSTSTSTTSTSAVIIDTTTPAEVKSATPVGDAAASASSTPAPAIESPVVETTAPAAVSTTSTTETPVAAPATTAAAEVTTSSTSTNSVSSTSTSSSPASTSSTSSSSETGGEATYYSGNVAGGTCSFSGYTLPSSLFGTALSIDQWDTAANCGACVAIKGPDGNTVKAMIVDECPSCNSNHFDLFEDAFGTLSDLAAGVISIDWAYTSCDLDGPLTLKNKDGTSQYWFSMQVVNANEPVTSLEVSTDGGSTWQSTTRTYYNYFENESGFGTETVDVRVTGKSGNTVVVKNVGCESETEITASSNL